MVVVVILFSSSSRAVESVEKPFSARPCQGFRRWVNRGGRRDKKGKKVIFPKGEKKPLFFRLFTPSTPFLFSHRSAKNARENAISATFFGGFSVIHPFHKGPFPTLCINKTRPGFILCVWIQFYPSFSPNLSPFFCTYPSVRKCFFLICIHVCKKISSIIIQNMI